MIMTSDFYEERIQPSLKENENERRKAKPNI